MNYRTAAAEQWLLYQQSCKEFTSRPIFQDNKGSGKARSAVRLHSVKLNSQEGP